MSNISKKLENFWYYHKVHVFVAIFIIAAIGYTVYDKVTYIEPDFSIDCFSDNTFLSYEVTDKMEEEISAIDGVSDINGDGHKKALISVYSAGDADTSTGAEGGSAYEVMQLKMAVGDSAIIFADKSVAEMFEKHDIFKDLSAIADSLGIEKEDTFVSSKGDIIGIRLDNTEFMKKYDIEAKDLYLMLRVSMETTDEKMLESAPYVAEYILK